ncbi:MAG: methyl-accepting chemotaxis protein, partial [Thiomonas sp.]|uniref:methyl-accepting chemotaxis protein n=1 Tax=Thiomonas sp. TaxID=2047785 RepID=UPI002A36A44C
MFTRLRIGTRLALAFALLVALLLANAGYGLYQAANIQGRFQEVVQNRLAKERAMTDINQSYQRAESVLLRSLLTQQFSAADQAILDKQRRDIEQSFATLSALHPTPKMQALLDPLRADLTQTRRAQQTAMQEMQQSNFGTATADYLKATRDLDLRIRHEIDAAEAWAREQTRALYAQSEADFASARNASIGLALLALLLAIAAAWLITRSITRPLSQAVEVARRVAGGDLSVRVVSPSKDETGQLLAALGQMVTQLTAVIGSVRSSAEQLLSASGQVSSTSQSIAQS